MVFLVVNNFSFSLFIETYPEFADFEDAPQYVLAEGVQRLWDIRTTERRFNNLMVRINSQQWFCQSSEQYMEVCHIFYALPCNLFLSLFKWFVLVTALMPQ